jgi:hypothetical protein
MAGASLGRVSPVSASAPNDAAADLHALEDAGHVGFRTSANHLGPTRTTNDWLVTAVIPIRVARDSCNSFGSLHVCPVC